MSKNIDISTNVFPRLTLVSVGLVDSEKLKTYQRKMLIILDYIKTVFAVVLVKLKKYQRKMPMSKNMQERFLFFFYNKPFIVNICKFTLHFTIIWLKEQGV